MKKNLFKKIVAVVMSLTMALGTSSFVFARQANGENVAAKGKIWSSFSVCTREDGGTWEDALKGVEVKDENGNFLRYQTKGQDYATEGYIASGVTQSNFDFYVKNSGWDGEYNEITGDLVGDNPWGMTAEMTGIPVENNRYYTISFKIKSTLKVSNTVTDEAGNEVTEDVTTKHILFKAFDPVSPGEPGIEFITTEGCTAGGYIELDSAKDEWVTVTAQIKIGDKRTYRASEMGVNFAMGSMLVTYPDEIAMSGYVYVKDFQITAGDQYTVTYKGATGTQTSYVNAGETAESVNIGKKGYTLSGYKNVATGATYNFSTPVTSNLTLEAQYVKTAKPAKVKLKKVKPSGKKKAKVTYGKVSKAVGYEIRYAYKKNMKGSKKVTTSKASYKLKKLKSGKIVFVQVRAYVNDSLGNKVYGKWSNSKRTYVK